MLQAVPSLASCTSQFGANPHIHVGTTTISTCRIYDGPLNPAKCMLEGFLFFSRRILKHRNSKTFFPADLLVRSGFRWPSGGPPRALRSAPPARVAHRRSKLRPGVGWKGKFRMSRCHQSVFHWDKASEVQSSGVSVLNVDPVFILRYRSKAVVFAAIPGF